MGVGHTIDRCIKIEYNKIMYKVYFLPDIPIAKQVEPQLTGLKMGQWLEIIVGL